VQKEQDIRKMIEYENEMPTQLDFLILYLRMIKWKTVSSIDVTEKTSNFLLDLQTISYDICKGIIVDATCLKYKPSILAAGQIYIAFMLKFEDLMR
jgi:hypothetical protein